MADNSEAVEALIALVMVLVMFLAVATNSCSEHEARYKERMKTHAEEATNGR